MVHNESNRAFVLSEKGASRMDIHYQWEHEEAPRRGLRNPWNYRPDRPIKYKKILHRFGNSDKVITATHPIYKDYTEDEMTAWKIERDEYMRQRDEWIALQMFNEYGYEIFLKECEIYGLTEEFKKNVFPCESLNEAQCNLYCPIYNDCIIKERG